MDYNSANYKYSLYVIPVSSGYTNLVIKAKDGSGVIKKVPIGVFKKGAIANASGITEYGKITITFDKAEDESTIDGYVIRRIRGYANVDPIYIPKTGADKYTYVISEGLSDGVTYGYRIYTYNFKDDIYYERHKKNVYDLVMPEKVPVTEITTPQTTYNIERGTNSNIYATVNPSDASVTALDWQLCDTDIADIEILKDSSGKEYAKITGKKKGQTILTLMSRDGENIIKRINITVFDSKEPTSSQEETTTVPKETTSVQKEPTSSQEKTTSSNKESTSSQEETTSSQGELTSSQGETTSSQEESTSSQEETTAPEEVVDDDSTPQRSTNNTKWVFFLAIGFVALAIITVIVIRKRKSKN